jgi:hypothetical protein
MRQVRTLLLAGALVALILQPVSLTVNIPSNNNALLADGMPPPPFPPSLNQPMTAAGIATPGGSLPS